MARRRKDGLPQYLECHPINRAFYYKNPSMPTKANSVRSFEDIAGDRIVSAIRKSDSQSRDIEATSVDFPIHPDVRRVIAEARRSSLRVGRCPFIVHRLPEHITKRTSEALSAGRVEHPARVLPEYASKSFDRARRRE